MNKKSALTAIAQLPRKMVLLKEFNDTNAQHVVVNFWVGIGFVKGRFGKNTPKENKHIPNWPRNTSAP